MSDTTADPTMDLYEALNRADPADWGRIVFSMPIFVEHDGYEVDDGKDDKGNDKKRLVVVPKGEKPPPDAKRIYTVDKARLEAITAEINREYDESGTPIKLFIGHSDPKKPQNENPPIAGYGRKAYLGTFGPQKRLAIKTDAFYRRGYEDTAAEYPERSPEFLPRTNGITGVAMLRTDPRLKMGALAFASAHDEVIYYGQGFMSETIDYAVEHKPAGPGGGQFAAVGEAAKNAKVASAAVHKDKQSSLVGGGNATKKPSMEAHGASKESLKRSKSAKSDLDHGNAMVAHQGASHKHREAERTHRDFGNHAAASAHGVAANAHWDAAKFHEGNWRKDSASDRIDNEDDADDIDYAEDAMTTEDTINNAEPVAPAAKPNPFVKEEATEAEKPPLKKEADRDELEDETLDDEDETSPAAKPQPFQPHEVEFANRLMTHYEANHPAIKHLCGEHKKYMDTQAAMAQPAPKPAPTAPGATNGFPPANGTNGKKKSKEGDDADDPKKSKSLAGVNIHMADTERINYAEVETLRKEVADLKEHNAILYATEAVAGLEAMGKVIKDKPKEIAKLVALPTLEARQERLAEIKLNYADAERSPARHQSWLPVDNSHVEGATREEDVRIPSALEIIRYGQEHKVDTSTEDGLRQAMIALTKTKAA